jgi:hydrogenase maturation protease
MKAIAVGIGNLLRCDDGAGIHAINILSETTPQLDTYELALGSIDLIEEIKSYDRVYIIDAVKTGAEPGTIFRVNIAEDSERPEISYSHGVDLFTTLELAQTLYPDEMPKDVIIYGIEAKNLIKFDLECTEPVRLAIKQITDEIHRDMIGMDS